MKKILITLNLSVGTLLLLPGLVLAQDKAGPDFKVVSDTLWVLITAALVFFMNAGFATVESGLCRAKNTVNILSKNVIVFCVTTLAFWAVGFAFMFGDGSPFLGLNGFFLSGPDNSPATAEAYKGIFSSLNWTSVPLFAKFFFQLVFAGTAATIVSGAVAERIKYFSFFLFSFLMGTLIYPIQGHWIWGGGWLTPDRFQGFRRLDGGPQHWRLGCSRRRNPPRTPARQVRGRRTNDPHSGSQHGPRNHRRLYSLDRMVRVQWGEHDGG